MNFFADFADSAGDKYLEISSYFYRCGVFFMMAMYQFLTNAIKHSSKQQIISPAKLLMHEVRKCYGY